MSEFEMERECQGGMTLSFSPLSFALGLAIGVAATMVFAAYAEDKFSVAVDKTRKIGDRAAKAAEVARDKALVAANSAANQVQEKIGQAKSAIKEKVSASVC